VQKDPNARLPFAIDWTAWLANEGDTAASFAWTVPAGITKEAEAAVGGKATVWLSGGTDGQTYKVTCRLSTTGGRIDDRTIKVRVIER
jgi:hypothetical protein